MELIVETFINVGESSPRHIRVRPLPGQLDREYRVWCSVSAREEKSIGTLYRVLTTWVRAEGRDPYLRISPNDPWHPVTATEARRLIAAKVSGGKNRRKR